MTVTAIQTGRNIAVAYASQTTPGTPPAQGTSNAFRLNSGGLSLSKGAIKSGENRRDGLQTRARHGMRDVKGSYAADLSYGSFDPLIAAGFRGTLGTATTVTQAAMSSATITTATHTITASAGSWITAGFKVGDIVRNTAGLAPEDQNKILRITALTAAVMTVAETLSTVSAVATWSFTSGKKLLQGTTPAAFYIEEQELDIGISEGFDWCKIGGLTIAMQPNGMGTINFTIAGRDGQAYDDESSPTFPYFTGTPDTTDTIGMTAVEAKLLLGGVEVADLTALSLDINLNAASIPVIGSTVTPDILTNLADMSNSSITVLREDASRVKAFLEETQVSLHVVFTDLDDPANYCSFFVGNMTYGGNNKSNIGSDGPRTATIPLMIGADDRGGAYDPGMVKFQTN